MGWAGLGSVGWLVGWLVGARGSASQNFGVMSISTICVFCNDWHYKTIREGGGAVLTESVLAAPQAEFRLIRHLCYTIIDF